MRRLTGDEVTRIIVARRQRSAGSSLHFASSPTIGMGDAARYALEDVLLVTGCIFQESL